MEISALGGIDRIALVGIRQPDGTINLGSSGTGPTISGWPDSIEFPDADSTSLELSGCGPTELSPVDGRETAWYTRF